MKYNALIALFLSAALNAQVIDQPWNVHVIDNTLFGADGVKYLSQGGSHIFTVGWEQSGKSRAYVYNSSMEYQHYVEVTTPGVEDAFVCDLDKDGNLDILSFLDEGGTNITLFYANGNLITNSATTFTSKVIAASSGPQWMYGEMMDVNGDGYLDIVGGAKKTGARLSVFINPQNSSGTWVEKKIDDAGWIMSIRLLDMDADGDKDVLVSDRDYTPKGVKWYENPGTANYTGTWTKHVIGLTGASHNPMFLNVYEDTEIKILATSLTQGVYLFRENNSYAEEKLFAIPAACGEWMKDVAYHDLDGDGDVEIVYSINNAYGTHGVNYATPNGSGGYIHHAISGIQSPKYDNLLFFDMDGDGDDDILSTEENDNSVSVKGMGFFWYENKMNETASLPCEEKNVLLRKSLVNFSSQQVTDSTYAQNINDSSNVGRWAAEGFPQWLIVDMGQAYDINCLEMVPNKNRDYQFKVELSDDLSNWTMACDATNNTDGGALISKSFSAKTGRYARFTVTGAATYTGTWATIMELRLFNTCLTISEKENQIIKSNISVYPNPAKDFLTIEGAINKSLSLYDEKGTLYFSDYILDYQYVLNLKPFSSGKYILALGNDSFVIVKI